MATYRNCFYCLVCDWEKMIAPPNKKVVIIILLSNTVIGKHWIHFKYRLTQMMQLFWLIKVTTYPLSLYLGYFNIIISIFVMSISRWYLLFWSINGCNGVSLFHGDFFSCGERLLLGCGADFRAVVAPLSTSSRHLGFRSCSLWAHQCGIQALGVWGFSCSCGARA